MTDEEELSLFEDLPHHQGRKPWSSQEQKGSVPRFQLELLADEASVRFSCTRCGKSVVVDEPLDPAHYQGQTRPCFHCFRISWVPTLPTV